MGRKTWDSIPRRFRPLADRINIVITRRKAMASTAEVMRDADVNADVDSNMNDHGSRTNPIFVNSLESALQATSSNPQSSGSERIFVIGGAQIYEAALHLKEAKRILLTRILTDFDCDTRFPLLLGQDGTVKGDTLHGWEKSSKKELSEWTGEIIPPASVQEENGIQYIFEMWERKEM